MLNLVNEYTANGKDDSLQLKKMMIPYGSKKNDEEREKCVSMCWSASTKKQKSWSADR